ncbi:MAG: tRNA pseudouridine(38-40) synthase TruA [Gammaproteobacteria bacterium CG11_big_fil_rev_8_21_14_0_20_46_22]|nr:MAG: tRNA pseudouridine(38-40) synthase TruA [Gammaproteobacteria bacterium CG12_big_fil_rev_8_21_14_0_65_46_12]PIR11647.1 MAG: tRNA pseudouridine(38-40) synthase TruA [Gammaproteobacteria bacterium CG11_big_fil_rev_8_21_14_0_20_46_22]
MKRFALALNYLGTEYKGWQSQPGLSTVQGELERALSSVANEPIAVFCAGRTDAGVHAAKQVVHFDTTAERDLYNWVLGVNSNLPKDIAVKWMQPVGEDFHARFSATARHYRYFLYHQRNRDSLLQGRAAHHCMPLDIASMQTAAAYFLGEHDFSSFRAIECQANTTVRTVSRIELTAHNNLLCLDIKANAFLHHMVRNIMGTLLAVGAGKEKPEWVKDVIEAKDRTVAGITAPAEGLYMVDIDYPKVFDFPKDPLFHLFNT